jgi:hypothetical protein
MVNVLPETNETEGESAGGQVRVTWSMFYLRPMRHRVSQLEDK